MKNSELRTVFREADRVGYTPGTLSLLKTCCEIADSQFDLDAGFSLRHELMNLAVGMMRVDVLLEAFNWTLYQYDCEPDRFRDWNPLQQYRWVVGRVCNYPKLTRQNYDEMSADMIRRYRDAEASLRSLYVNRRSVAQDFGDPKMARSAHQELQHCPPAEYMSKVTEHAYEIEYLLFIGDEAEAIQRAEQFLDDPDYGDVHNSEIRSQLLLPLARSGRMDEAHAIQRQTVLGIDPERGYFWPYGNHLKFLTLTGRLEDARELYPALQRAAFRNSDPLTQLHFALDALPYLERQLQSGAEAPELQLPESIPDLLKTPGNEVKRLRDWLFQHALELAGAFDQRNGNIYFSQAVKSAPNAAL